MSVAQLMVRVLTLALSVMGLAVTASATAQLARIEAGKRDDLRTLYATPADVNEGKRLAETTCGGCHSVAGSSSVEGVPHLAGQRPPYLYTELRAYQSGARGASAMANAVKFVSDDALIKVSAYYGSLDPPQPVVTSAAKAAPAKLDALQAGKAATAACAGCHGEGGISATAGMPSLVGLDPKYFIAAMNAYKSGQRKNDTMKAMAAGLSDADVNTAALYYALQKPARAKTPSPGDQPAGKTAAAACAGCHGEKGVSASAANPSLAGQDAQYLAMALEGYKNGARSDGTMKSLAAALDERTARDIAAFYANQQPQAINVRKPLSLSDWTQRCDRCHGVNGNSADPRIPSLAAQRGDYLNKVLHAYRSGERKSPQMAAMTDALSDADIEALAAHYSRQNARSAVFVVVPAK